MGRWVSPWVTALAVLLVLGMLLVQGVVSPLRGVRADSASSPADASAVVPAASSPTTTLVVTNPNTDPVNVRAMPTTDSVILVQIAAGDRAVVVETNVPGLERGTTWMRVAYQGRTGYVRSDLVSPPRVLAAATASLPATRIPVGSATAATPTVMPTATLPPAVTVVPLAPFPSPFPSPTADTSVASTTVPTPVLTVAITNLTSPVKAGATAIAKVQTASGAKCAIDVQDLTTDNKAAGVGDRVADRAGVVSWTWQVGTKTAPGSWPILVTCVLGDQTALGRMYLDVT